MQFVDDVLFVPSESVEIVRVPAMIYFSLTCKSGKAKVIICPAIYDNSASRCRNRPSINWLS